MVRSDANAFAEEGCEGVRERSALGGQVRAREHALKQHDVEAHK